jgi:hypothetical protein
MQGYHILKQSKYESLGDYRKRFDAALRTMVQSGLHQYQLPDDDAMAKSFIVDWINGLLPNLTSVERVQARSRNPYHFSSSLV